MSLKPDFVDMTTSPEVEAALALLRTTPESRARATRNERMRNKIKAWAALLDLRILFGTLVRGLGYHPRSSAVVSSSSSLASTRVSGPCITIRVLPRRQRISFNELDDDVRFLIYEYVCRDRKDFKTDMATLSPAWKSPQSPAALMNTCTAVAFELMPFYFGAAQFTLDVTRNDLLRDKALDWFAKVGDIHSAHFNNIRVVSGVYSGHPLQLEIQVSEQREVTVKGIDCDMYSTPSVLHKDLIEGLQSTLDHRIKTSSTGYLGGVELKIIVESVKAHLSTFTSSMNQVDKFRP